MERIAFLVDGAILSLARSGLQISNKPGAAPFN